MESNENQMNVETQETYGVDFAKKNSSAKKLLYIVALVVVAVIVWAWRGIYVPVQHDGTQTFTVEEGTGVSAIADQLEEIGYIRSAFLFKVYARFDDSAASSLKAGEYRMVPEMNVQDIVRQLTLGGDSGTTVQVTLVEGWREDQMLEALQEAGLQITQTQWETALANVPQQIPAVFLTGKPSADYTWEGYLYPETYEFFVTATAEDVVKKLTDQFVAEMQPVVDQARGTLSAGLDFYEVLTIASIVERELLTADERAGGASVFVQRYVDNYPLESDATVNYVTGKKTTRPSFADLAVESEYNTYQNIGLPPTPISNPSSISVEAVWKAEPTPYYFFLTTPEGDAIFSKTFEEHLVNKAKYYPN